MAENFGDILDKWDNVKTSDKGRKAKETPALPSTSDGSMEEWLRRYPPERDDPEPDAGDLPAAKKPRQANPDRIKVDDTIDLHGYRLEEALQVTSLFVERSVESGYRKILIIHGKGDNGQGVLRREIRAYLERHPMTGAMGHGRGTEGGRGALWVMIRDRRGADSAPDRHRSR